MSDYNHSPVKRLRWSNPKTDRKNASFPKSDNEVEVTENLFQNKSENSIKLFHNEALSSIENNDKNNFGDIFEKLFENVSILREENKRFQEEKIEWMALIDEKNQKIVDLTDQILKQRFTSASFQFMEKDKRASSLEMMLMDVGEERNKLRNRIELLREELDSQYKENEENLKKLQNKFEDETQENFKKELNILLVSQQKIVERSMQFDEINEEKVIYYQNLAINLKNELENIEASHKKEVSLLKELAASQIKQNLENQKILYEGKLKKLESEHLLSLTSQNNYISELEELIKSLICKNGSLDKEKQKVQNEKESLTRDIMKLYQQNYEYQETIDQLIPMHTSQLKKLESKFIQEKSTLTFELKTLKKNMSKEENEVSTAPRCHKKNFSHDYKEISNLKALNNTNLAFELSNNFDKLDEKKSSFYFKNSIVDSIKTNSEASSLKREGLSKKELAPSIMSPIQIQTKENCVQIKEMETSKELSSKRSVSKPLNSKASMLLNSHTPSINVYNQINPPSHTPSINIFNQINPTFIIDSGSMVTNHFKNENIDLDAFNEAFYINENEKIIRNINIEFSQRLKIPSLKKIENPDQEKLFQNLKKFLKNLYTENLLVSKELLKKTLDKFDSHSIRTLLFFDLISITIKGYEKQPDGHFEYIIELFDKLLTKTWEIKARYSKLRRLHLETKFSFALEGRHLEISEFPTRKWFGNNDQIFLEHRKKRLQAYFDSYIKNKNSLALIDRGILRHFFYREIWANIESAHRKNLEELEEAKDFSKISYEKMVSKINDVFEGIKTNLELAGRSEAMVFIYYQNKLKALSYQEPKLRNNSIL